MEYTLELAKKLWDQLGNVPVDDDENLDEDFVIKDGIDVTFEKGIPNTEVWHWFEETFNISVAKDLMYLD